MRKIFYHKLKKRISNLNHFASNAWLANRIKSRYSVKREKLEVILKKISKNSNKLKLLLVYPPKGKDKNISAYGEVIPLALKHREKEAKQNGWDVKIVNLTEKPSPHLFLAEEVKKFNPQLIAFSTTSPSEAMAFSLSKYLHKQNLTHDKLIIKGGPGTEYSFLEVRKLLNSKSPIDAFFLGDADKSFISFLKGVKQGDLSKLSSIDGVGYSQFDTPGAKAVYLKIGDRTFPNPQSLEAMGEKVFPSLLYDEKDKEFFRVHIDKHKFLDVNQDERMVRIQTSTKCNFGCSFCATSRKFGPHTKKPVKEVIEEIKNLTKNGLRNFYFEDAHFGSDVLKNGKYTYELLDGLKKLKQNLENNNKKNKLFRFGIQTRLDTLSKPNFIKHLSDAGCKNVFIGIETLSPAHLNEMNKGSFNSIEILEDVFKSLNKENINSTVSLIVGKYTGSLKNFKFTLEMIDKLEAKEIFLQAGALYPGTPDWKNSKATGEHRRNILSYLTPKSFGSKVLTNTNKSNPEDYGQYLIYDKSRKLRKYYSLANKLLFKHFKKLNEGHYVDRRIYSRYFDIYKGFD